MSISATVGTAKVQTRMQNWAARYKSFSPHTVAMLLWAALALLCLALFLHFGMSVRAGGAIQSLDEQIMRYIGEHIRSADRNYLFVDLSSLGSLAVVSALSIISVSMLLLVRDPAAAIHLLVTVSLGFPIAAYSKGWFARPRPDILPKLIQVGGQAFPSGHSVTAATVYTTLAILACRHFKGHAARVTLFVLAGLMIATVSFARVYIGVHWPSDVFCGALLGGAWALFMGALFSKPHFGRVRHQI